MSSLTDVAEGLHSILEALDAWGTPQEHQLRAAVTRTLIDAASTDEAARVVRAAVDLARSGEPVGTVLNLLEGRP